MKSEEETLRVVKAYFDAWTHQRTDEAFALLAPDLAFAGPTASYQTAEAFRPGLIGFAKMTRGARIVEIFAADDRAAMLYDCDLPIGTLRIASFFRVAGGKIAGYDTRFDMTALGPFLAAQAR